MTRSQLLIRPGTATLMCLIAACSDNTPTRSEPGRSSVTAREDVAVGSITLTPDSITAHAGREILFAVQAVVVDVRGRELTGVPVEWSTSDTSVAYISVTRSDSGVPATAWIAGRGRSGSVNIMASIHGRMATAAIALEDLTRVPMRSVVAGQIDRLCLLTTTGAAYCQGGWAVNAPVRMSGELAFGSVAVGRNHSCALTPADVAYCWGRNYDGQLGAQTQEICNPADAHLKTSCEPLRVSGDHAFTQIAVGRFHTCGLTKEAAVFCWGERFGASPVPVGGERRFVKIDAGMLHTCGLTDSGVVYCWGHPYSQYADTIAWDDPGSREPVPVAPATTFTDFVVGSESSISGERDHACGRTTEGAVLCWIATAADSVRLFEVSLPAGVSLAAMDGGLRHTCGLATDGAAYCWGWVFDWDVFDRRAFEPTRVQGLAFVSVSSGGGGFDGEEGRACGLATDGRAYCWDPAIGQPWPVLR